MCFQQTCLSPLMTKCEDKQLEGSAAAQFPWGQQDRSRSKELTRRSADSGPHHLMLSKLGLLEKNVNCTLHWKIKRYNKKERNICSSFTNFLVIFLSITLHTWRRTSLGPLMQNKSASQTFFFFPSSLVIKVFWHPLAETKDIHIDLSQHNTASLPETPGKLAVPCWAPWGCGYIPNLKLAQMHLYELQPCKIAQPHPKKHWILWELPVPVLLSQEVC